MVNIMPADVLEMQGGGPSAGLIWTWVVWNITGLHTMEWISNFISHFNRHVIAYPC